MPITLSKIANNTATVTLQDGEDSANITYYPARVTEKIFQQMKSFEDADANNLVAGFETLNAILVHLIKEWDLFEDDAQTIMFPLDPDRLAELPIIFRMQVVYAILGDLRPEMLAPQTPTQSEQP